MSLLGLTDLARNGVRVQAAENLARQPATHSFCAEHRMGLYLIALPTGRDQPRGSVQRLAARNPDCGGVR